MKSLIRMTICYLIGLYDSTHILQNYYVIMSLV